MNEDPEIILDFNEFKKKLFKPLHTTCILTAGSIKPNISSILRNCVE